MSADGVGFFTGGDDAIPGMVTFDSNTMSWKNETSDIAISQLVRGAMVFTGFGPNGTLIAIGGYYKNGSNTSTANVAALEIRDMSNTGVYDIASAIWYNVTAQGDVPVNRANFCAAVSVASDYSR